MLGRWASDRISETLVQYNREDMGLGVLFVAVANSQTILGWLKLLN